MRAQIRDQIAAPVQAGESIIGVAHHPPFGTIRRITVRIQRVDRGDGGQVVQEIVYGSGPLGFAADLRNGRILVTTVNREGKGNAISHQLKYITPARRGAGPGLPPRGGSEAERLRGGESSDKNSEMDENLPEDAAAAGRRPPYRSRRGSTPTVTPLRGARTQCSSRSHSEEEDGGGGKILET